jgi:hypothetical protein
VVGLGGADDGAEPTHLAHQLVHLRAEVGHHGGLLLPLDAALLGAQLGLAAEAAQLPAAPPPDELAHGAGEGEHALGGVEDSGQDGEGQGQGGGALGEADEVAHWWCPRRPARREGCRLTDAQ